MEGLMAQVLVRNIEDSVHDRLRLRAERHGRSLEEELRDILRAAAEEGGPSEEVPLGTWIASQFRGRGLDFDIEEIRGGTLQVPDFS
jgi:plasmid stability protein